MILKIDNSLKKRFESKIEIIPECGCWIWMGATRRDGYGVIKYTNIKKQESTHRVSWRIFHGRIPKGLCVLHRCDTKSCVNPHHLFLGTLKDNTQDMMKKKRHIFFKGEECKKSKLSEKNVLEIRKIKNLSYQKIADLFGVSEGQISRIKNNQQWAHVPIT